MNLTVHLTAPVAVNRTYLSKLEKGASYPGLEVIAKLATVLEVELAELLRIPLGKPGRGVIRVTGY